jgi:hypothetical protein
MNTMNTQLKEKQSCKYANGIFTYLILVLFIQALSTVQVKLKLSLCLTKYYAMKKNPVLNETPRNEEIWGNGL